MTVLENEQGHVGSTRILQFSTRRQLKIYEGFIGINPECHIVTGYDNLIDTPSCPENLYNEHFTEQERNELADYMINLWQTYKHQYGAP